MKCFELHRDVDVSGVSGVGVVAQGVIFDNGMVAIAWMGERPCSVGVYPELAGAFTVHGHNGDTRFVEVANIDREQIARLLTTQYQDHCEGVYVDAMAKVCLAERDRALALLTPKPLADPRPE